METKLNNCFVIEILAPCFESELWRLAHIVIQVLISTFSVCLAVPGRPCGGGTAAVGQRRAGQHASRFLRVTPYPCSLWRTRGAGSLAHRERSQLGGGVWRETYLNANTSLHFPVVFLEQSLYLWNVPFFPTHTAVENSLKVFDSHTALLLLG